jgi:hypothetical protein
MTKEEEADRLDRLVTLAVAALRGVSGKVGGLNATQHGEWAAVCAKSALKELEK